MVALVYQVSIAATILTLEGEVSAAVDDMTIVVDGAPYPAPDFWDESGGHTVGYWLSGAGPVFVDGATYTVWLAPVA
jgi:hypothetical protein